jgi:hypothetical protein
MNLASEAPDALDADVSGGQQFVDLLAQHGFVGAASGAQHADEPGGGADIAHRVDVALGGNARATPVQVAQWRRSSDW